MGGKLGFRVLGVRLDFTHAVQTLTAGLPHTKVMGSNCALTMTLHLFMF